MAGETEPLVLYECRDRVATITFNRPSRLNAFNDDLARDALSPRAPMCSSGNCGRVPKWRRMADHRRGMRIPKIC